jgi:uncharacterized phiE125 gp8 family phage protein
MERAYNYHVITPPANRPLTLALVKTHLRLDPNDTSEDSYLEFLIDMATEFAEEKIRRVLINTKFRTFRDNFECCILLRKSKFQSLDLFEYMVDDSFTAVDSDLYYVTDEADFSKIVLKDGSCYPTDKDVRLQSIKIEFTAGYGADESAIPPKIKTALLQHIAALYENRGDCDTASMEALLPASAKNIYQMMMIRDLLNNYC